MSRPRRPHCPQCTRPTPYCVCPHVQVVAHRTPVLVLQHPDERKHPLNTARLAILGLARAECWVGLVFPRLAERLEKARNPVLLFPGPQALAPQAWGEPRTAEREPCSDHMAQALRQRAPDLLIVPDGTWRQAGRLVRCNPALGRLSRLALKAEASSRYRVRHARREGALSTIEAIVRALAILEPDTDFQPVLRPFETMVEGQIRAMGEQAYARHLALTAAGATDKPTTQPS